jgi:hypothetical protein
MSLTASHAVSAGGIVVSESVMALSAKVSRMMILTKLRAAAVALIFGVIAAGAMVSAQPAAGRREQPQPPAATQSPQAVVPGSAGHFMVDWFPAAAKGGKSEITVDATRHCVHVPTTNLRKDSRPNDGAVYLDLERGATYTVTAAGEAFLSLQTGVDADPFPGVVVAYGTDEEDCYAWRQVVLAPGKSITFRSPWLIDPPPTGSGVYLMAFFLDFWPHATHRGSYTLTVTESGERKVWP